VLTLIEIGIALTGIAAAAQVAVLLALAFTKALLVALYYMHLKFEGPIIRIIAAVPVLLVFLVILIPIFDVWIFG
jgi:caa(3)-type oxidase subunit IV